MAQVSDNVATGKEEDIKKFSLFNYPELRKQQVCVLTQLECSLHMQGVGNAPSNADSSVSSVTRGSFRKLQPPILGPLFPQPSLHFHSSASMVHVNLLSVI